MALASFVNTTKAVGTFQNLNLWEIVSLKLNGVSIPDTIKLRCVSAGLPSQESEVLKASVNRFNLKQPAQINRDGTLKLTFLESDDALTSQIFDQIEKIKYNMSSNDVSGTGQGWSAIKGSLIMYLLNAQGKRTQGYEIVEMWAQPEWDNELGTDPEVMKFSLTIEYNWWYYLKA